MLTRSERLPPGWRLGVAALQRPGSSRLRLLQPRVFRAQRVRARGARGPVASDNYRLALLDPEGLDQGRAEVLYDEESCISTCHSFSAGNRLVDSGYRSQQGLVAVVRPCLHEASTPAAHRDREVSLLAASPIARSIASHRLHEASTLTAVRGLGSRRPHRFAPSSEREGALVRLLSST